MGKTAALVRKAIPIAGIGNVRQPQHDRAQSALALGGPMASDPIAGGCAGFHGLHVTFRSRAFNPLAGPGHSRSCVRPRAAWRGEVAAPTGDGRNYEVARARLAISRRWQSIRPLAISRARRYKVARGLVGTGTLRYM